MGLGRTYEERKGYVRGSQEVRGGGGWRAPCAVMAFGKVYTPMQYKALDKKKVNLTRVFNINVNTKKSPLY